MIQDIIGLLDNNHGRIRFGFEQEIIRKSDSKVVAKALNLAVCVLRETGRPTMPDELKVLLSTS